MSGKTKIEWAERVWNPMVGCTMVSKGCRNCYAKTLHDRRHKAKLNGANLPEQYAQQFEVVQLMPDRLSDPFHWKKPARVFVNSVSDLFHEDVPDDFIDKAFAVMSLCPQHTFMVLTKRPDRMRRWFRDIGGTQRSDWVWSAANRLMNTNRGKYPYFPLPNVWLGVSVEDQKTADERIPLLLRTPAAVRFVSCEPLLGAVDLEIGVCQQCGGCGETAGHYFQEDGIDTCTVCGGSGRAEEQIDWVICGGESGSKARPMHPDWARSLRDQCNEAGVPFFFKQWGEWHPHAQHDGGACELREWQLLPLSGELPKSRDDLAEAVDMCRVGKRAAGRLLDGREWNEFPEVRK